ncbi:hypothetical protein A0256_23420 [Mucilaginibacter sp. PAMC 26640]|nr:hypothetical protein A0256_23420 [Mucilaginibacter sp. PAMC 26640]
MTNLVTIQNNQTVTTSKLVAQAFDKQHYHVLRDIEALECSASFRESNFGFILSFSDLGHGRKREDKSYSITRDGFVFLAMGYTGKRAAEFKEAYIKAFNEMENTLRAVPENKYTIEDLIIAQAQSIKELKSEVRSLSEAVYSSPVKAQKSLPARTGAEDMYTVSQYIGGRNFSMRQHVLIGIQAKKYSLANSLTVNIHVRGNYYRSEAIEFGIKEITGLTRKF